MKGVKILTPANSNDDLVRSNNPGRSIVGESTGSLGIYASRPMHLLAYTIAAMGGDDRRSLVGRIGAAAGADRREGLRGFLPLHHRPRSGRGQGAQRRHQPTGARGEAGAHTARQGPEAAQRSGDAAEQAARQGARTARNDCAGGAGHRANPVSPRIKFRIRGAAAPDGEKGGRSAVRDAGGKRGEPPRGRTRDAADATGAATPTEQGAGRSARRQQDAKHRSGQCGRRAPA